MNVTTNPCGFSGNTPLPENIFNNDMVYYKTVVNGISGKVIKWAVSAMPKQKEAIVKALGTTSGNLSRLYSKATLDTHQTEEILDIVKLYTEVYDVFGSVDKADLWLSMSVPALRGEQPINLLDTFIGRKLVRETINKIRFGDFS
ncbi:DUF2384 domain-containing protein [Photobacterium phosphoreum]|uniref:DUF2384 domain-containing protein n=1 Tax=Photobacterium phosphoreum TaxID=659 RepID=A0A2T3JAD4_PHOPO|nr:antitoxin Xre/MbcA/ParS toxin-binding domain-containing protein [Photobacterium phosphoreum]PSU18417.1 DUF2384 domain-containing protein [Photobacterium phosphoreum]PSU36723.1 DUF2384 domain-containing protein [Photobacterium phosphoreum]PSU45820.1 DUF2384 domain-containing protein [Photobacterium phosphoreum]